MSVASAVLLPIDMIYGWGEVLTAASTQCNRILISSKLISSRPARAAHSWSERALLSGPEAEVLPSLRP